MHLDKYSAATSKQEKSRIVSSIVDTIRRSSANGGFVKLDPLTGNWFEVGDHLAREKVGQTLRDALHTKYSSSTKAKKRRRQAEKARARAVESHPEEPIAMPSTLSAFTASQQDHAPTPPLIQEQMMAPRPVQVQHEQFRPVVQVQQPSRAAQAVRDEFFRPAPQRQSSSSSLRKTGSSCLLDIFFDEKNYQALKDLNDDEHLNPSLVHHLSSSSPNIIRGKAA